MVSAEISPAGLIKLVSHCWGAVIELLSRGIMCRGYIKRGLIYHTDTQFIGTGYQSAFDEEGKVSVFGREAKERGTPYVAVDPDVVSYVAATNDKHVVEMFNRMVKQIGLEAALFPFKMLRHSFIIPFDGSFNAEEERQANQNMRASISNLKALVSAHIDRSNERAVEKTRHYIEALDAQLEACNRLDARIEMHSKWL